MNTDEQNFEFEPTEIAAGVFWLGHFLEEAGLPCNSYLVTEENEALVIDGPGGFEQSRFSALLPILSKAGFEPEQITALIYQQGAGSFCSELTLPEALTNNSKLKIIAGSFSNNNQNRQPELSEKPGYFAPGSHFTFAGGRKLNFYPTPFCHQPGSFITYDKKTRTLFSGALFGGFYNQWSLTLKMDDSCRKCRGFDPGCRKAGRCPVAGIRRYHQQTISSNQALAHALGAFEELNIARVAPRHGSIIAAKDEVQAVAAHLRTIGNVGINRLLAGEI